MNKSLFAAISAASLSVSLLAPCARAQYGGANGMQFNNMMSATMSSMIQGMGNMSMMRSRSGSDSGPSGHDLQQARGNRAIRSGRSTVIFAVQPIPMSHFVHDDPARREQDIAEFHAQTAIWREEAQARNAHFNNMAEASALAVVVALEAYTGQRVNNAGFEDMAQTYTKSLLGSSTFQGSPAQRKQEVYEERAMIPTYALYLTREGRKRGDQTMIAKGRAEARGYLEGVWKADTDTAIKRFARFTQPDAPTTRPRSAKAAAPSIQAAQIVRFSPSAPILPALLAAQEAASERAEAAKTYNALLLAGREQMSHFFKVSKQDNVAQAMTYAVGAFYTLAKTDSGRAGDAGLTAEKVAGLERQFTTLLANDPKFRASSARQKQQTFESAVLMAATLGAMHGQAKNAAAREQVRAAAGRALQNIVGVPVQNVTLSNAGLEF